MTRYEGMTEKELMDLRELVLARMARVGPFRRGSLQRVWRKCGSKTCHCAKPGDPGHGPKTQWTRTARGGGGSRGQAIPPAHADVVRGELGSFAQFQALVEDYVEVNEQICVDRASAAMGRAGPGRQKRGS
ncbi:MAG: hypothetical protein LBC97_11680 [Bifidobacteriaceae bacterium]|jgi:hypothetical protein|nr:hypothetical protein [Bifidobacteriaceae bacterium]